MRVLALDTSTSRQTVALVEGERTLAARQHEVQRGHTGTLLESIHACLGEARLKPAEVDLVAVGIGPGTFTGLRIGVAAAKAFCLAVDRPVAGVDSLAAIAYGRPLRPEQLAVTATDARKGEVYAAVWQIDAAGWPEAVLEAAAYRPAALADRLLALQRPLAGLGNGFALYAAIFENGLGDRLERLPDEQGWPRATSVAALGRRQVETRGPSSLDALEPHYVRPTDAVPWSKPGSRPSGGRDAA